MQGISQRFLHLLHLPFLYLQSVADLSKFAVPLIMNSDTQWTLEPWHVKLALLRHGVTVEEESITLPEHKFSGPNEAYEGGEILINLKVELPDVMMNLVDQFYLFIFRLTIMKQSTSGRYFFISLFKTLMWFPHRAGTCDFIRHCCQIKLKLSKCYQGIR